MVKLWENAPILQKGIDWGELTKELSIIWKRKHSIWKSEFANWIWKRKSEKDNAMLHANSFMHGLFESLLDKSDKYKQRVSEILFWKEWNFNENLRALNGSNWLQFVKEVSKVMQLTSSTVAWIINHMEWKTNSEINNQSHLELQKLWDNTIKKEFEAEMQINPEGLSIFPFENSKRHFKLSWNEKWWSQKSGMLAFVKAFWISTSWEMQINTKMIDKEVLVQLVNYSDLFKAVEIDYLWIHCWVN